MVYHIKQYEKVIRTYIGPRILTDVMSKIVTKKLIKIAKEAIDKGEMVTGAFEVEVCNTNGEIVDNFLSGTDYK